MTNSEYRKIVVSNKTIESLYMYKDRDCIFQEDEISIIAKLVSIYEKKGVIECTLKFTSDYEFNELLSQFYTLDSSQKVDFNVGVCIENDLGNITIIETATRDIAQIDFSCGYSSSCLYFSEIGIELFMQKDKEWFKKMIREYRGK